MKRALAVLSLVVLLLPGCSLFETDSRKDGNNEGSGGEPEAYFDARPAARGYA